MIGHGQIVVAERLALTRDPAHDFGRGKRPAVRQVEPELHVPLLECRRRAARAQFAPAIAGGASANWRASALHCGRFPAKFAEMANSIAKRQIIGVVSQKGGVGKSTLCQLIAREAAAAGKQAKILDFDVKQMSSTDWVRARLERDLEPLVEAEPAKNIEKALRHNRGYDVVVLDGAAGTP